MPLSIGMHGGGQQPGPPPPPGGGRGLPCAAQVKQPVNKKKPIKSVLILAKK